VGSVGYHFCDALAAAATRHGMAVGHILQGLIGALVHYHRTEAKQ